MQNILYLQPVLCSGHKAGIIMLRCNTVEREIPLPCVSLRRGYRRWYRLFTFCHRAVIEQNWRSKIGIHRSESFKKYFCVLLALQNRQTKQTQNQPNPPNDQNGSVNGIHDAKVQHCRTFASEIPWDTVLTQHYNLPHLNALSCQRNGSPTQQYNSSFSLRMIQKSKQFVVHNKPSFTSLLRLSLYPSSIIIRIRPY